MKEEITFSDEQQKAIRSALLFVAGKLPASKQHRAAPAEIEQEAIQHICFDGDAGDAARKTIRRFINLCPAGYGAIRKNSWWTLLGKFFGSVDVLAIYFEGFPEEITLLQRRDVIAYLVRRHHVPEEIITRHLDAMFRLRPNRDSGQRVIARPYFVS